MKPIDDTTSDVGEALALLSETLTEEEERIRREGATAMQQGEYDTASDVIAFAKRLLAFQEKVAELEREWQELETVRDASTPEVQEIVSRHFFRKARKGEITNYEEFCRPILEALVEMGGRGKTREVLDRVGEKMEAILKPIDFERHQSKGNQIRWRNSAQWARNLMVNKDGRMKSDSPNGIWEISEAGRRWLAEGDH